VGVTNAITKGMTIGFSREVKDHESRFVITPAGVHALTDADMVVKFKAARKDPIDALSYE